GSGAVVPPPEFGRHSETIAGVWAPWRNSAGEDEDMNIHMNVLEGVERKGEIG
ncbi:hypothetical protein A2U01_0012709, partial [Trifolium medium]|nr:hypothetical protein [Trifolium medium]